MDTVPLPVSVIVYTIQTEEWDFITIFWSRGGDAGREAEDLLERLWEEEALLHVVVADRRGVNVTDAREARLYSAVLLQGLAGDRNTLKRARKRAQNKGRAFYKNTFKQGVEHP